MDSRLRSNGNSLRGHCASTAPRPSRHPPRNPALPPDPQTSNISKDSNISTYWRKVHAVKECLKNKNCDSCIYLDSDAAVVPGNFSKQKSSLLGDKDFAFAPDWGRDRMNAGVFQVKNSEQGKKIVDFWLQQESKKWRKLSDGTFACESNGKKCAWAGPEYEQGAFIKKVIPKYSSFMNEVSPFLWDNDKANCDGNVKHFMGKGKHKYKLAEQYSNMKCPN